MNMSNKKIFTIPGYKEKHNAGALKLDEMLCGEGNNVPDHFRKSGELRQIDLLCGYVIPRDNEEKRIIRGLLRDRRHLVLGDIGSGKTTLLKKIGFKFMNDLGYEVLYIDGGACFKNKREIIRDIREMTGRDDIQLMVLFDNVHHSHEAANEIMNYLINKNIICLISSLNFQKDFSGNEICDILSRFSKDSRLITKIHGESIQDELINQMNIYTDDFTYNDTNKKSKKFKNDVANVMSDIINSFPDYCKTVYGKEIQTENMNLFTKYLEKCIGDMEKDIRKDAENPTTYFNKNREEIKESSGGNLHKLKAIMKLIIHDPTLFSDLNNREFNVDYLIEHVRKAFRYNKNDSDYLKLVTICKTFSVLKRYGINLPDLFLSELHIEGENKIEDSYRFLNNSELLWICAAIWSNEHNVEFITDTFINHISKNQQEVHNVFKVLSNPDYIDILMKDENVKQAVKSFFRNPEINIDEIGSFMLDTYRLSREFDGFIDGQVGYSTSVIIKKIFSENTSFESIFRFFGRLPWQEQNCDKKVELLKNNYKDSNYELCSQSVNFDSRPFKKGMMKIRESNVIDILEDKNLFSEYIICPMHTEADVCCICLKSRNFRTRESGIKLVELIADGYCEEFAEKVNNSLSGNTVNTDTVAEVYWIICLLNIISWIDKSSAQKIYDGLDKKLLKDNVLKFYDSESHPSKKDFVSVMYKAISGE